MRRLSASASFAVFLALGLPGCFGSKVPTDVEVEEEEEPFDFRRRTSRVAVIALRASAANLTTRERKLVDWDG